MQLTLQVLPEGDMAFEGDHRLIYGYLSVWGVCCLESCAETIDEWLNLPFLGGAVWIANIQSSKDLEEVIPGEDRSEEWQVGGVVCRPVTVAYPGGGCSGCWNTPLSLRNYRVGRLYK